MIRKLAVTSFFIPGLIILGMALQTPARAAEDSVVALVDGAKIRLSDITEARSRVPQSFRDIPEETLYPMLLNNLVETKLVAAEARRRGLENDPEIKADLARIKEQVLERTLLNRILDKSITEKDLRADYDRLIEKSRGKVEVRARHILLGTEKQARQALADLKSGEDFAELAGRVSIGPSASRGGDLGYFRRDEMVDNFADAAFALAVGEITQTPVQTQFGWHIIKLEDRRPVQPPSFEEAKPRLRIEAFRARAREVASAFVEKLKKTANIQMFNPDGSPLKPKKPVESEKPAN
jgi:peptidyl-prolyl cis-trans isomerase C